MQVQLKIASGAGSFSTFTIEADMHATILDLLETLRAGTTEVPAYRHSCHHGSCGTCGALINGKEMLLCLTRVQSCVNDADEPVITLEPLQGMRVIGGIAVYPGKVFAGIPNTSYLRDRHPDERRLSSAGTCPQIFEACIECGLCVSACPIRGPFIGPAALAAVNREREKNPGNAKNMLLIAGAPDGAAACERHLKCSRVCPQAVYPGKHIQLLKNALKAAK